MLQQSEIQWDPLTILREPPYPYKIYMLFLFVTLVVTGARLIRIWAAAPPFRLSRQAHNSTYVELLQRVGRDLGRWMGVASLGAGTLAALTMTGICNDKLMATTDLPPSAVLYTIRDFSVSLTMALLTLLFLFLTRWHILKRIERLQNQRGNS